MGIPIKEATPKEINRRFDEVEKGTGEDNLYAFVRRALESMGYTGPPEGNGGNGGGGQVLPDGIDQQFLIYDGVAGEWVPSHIQDLRVMGSIYVNADYLPGTDADAYIYFNADAESLIFDYGLDRFIFSTDLQLDGNMPTLHFNDLDDSKEAWLRFTKNSTYNWRILDLYVEKTAGWTDVVQASAEQFWITTGQSLGAIIQLSPYLTTHDTSIRFTGNSGTLLYDESEGAFDFSKQLRIRGDFRVQSNYTSGDVDAIIYFLATNHHLKWDYGNDRFEFDGDLYVDGDIIATGLTADGYEYVCHANAVVCHDNEGVYN